MTTFLRPVDRRAQKDGRGGGLLFLFADRREVGDLAVLPGTGPPLAAADREVIRVVAREIGVALNYARLSAGASVAPIVCAGVTRARGGT